MTSHQLAKVLLAAPDQDVRFYYDSGQDHLPIHQAVAYARTPLWGAATRYEPHILLAQEDYDMGGEVDGTVLYREPAPADDW